MSAMNLRSLRSIYLTGVYLTDERVHDLILGCPNLEDLKLKYCYGMKKLSICSTRLKKLVVWGEIYIRSCEVDCPNLSSIRIDSFSRFVFKNASSLVHFCFGKNFLLYKHYYDLWRTTVVGILKQAPQLRNLTVPNLWFKPLSSKDPYYLKSFMLHNLNHLELYTDYSQTFLVGMAALLELCPNLETMVLNDIEIKDLPEEFPNESIQFKIPRLKQVTMKLYDESKNQRNLLTILKMQGVVLEKIVLVSSRRGEKNIVISSVRT
uniref:putative F-box/FBD/LRR-repeat protein At5g44950 n=1 Tax=Fragaria vesca subsp. vesca TaxID=101020 RepID=UPI0005C8983B|nr:PREDICTED: putative F-box/FBD/LRR-repeat protein At5g44950 [Fragaria vesca subsp. vesca]